MSTTDQQRALPVVGRLLTEVYGPGAVRVQARTELAHPFPLAAVLIGVE